MCTNKKTFFSFTFFLFAFSVISLPVTVLGASYTAAECEAVGGECKSALFRGVSDGCTGTETPVNVCNNGGNCCKTVIRPGTNGEANSILSGQDAINFFNAELERGSFQAPLDAAQDADLARGVSATSQMTATRNDSSSSVSNPGTTYTLLEKIPGISETTLSLSEYVAAVYKLAIWIVGICALFMFLVGAFMYMLSAGNTSKMSSGKDIMWDALIGLVLAFTSYLILYVINPDLLTLRLPTTSSGTVSNNAPSAARPTSVNVEGQYTHAEAKAQLESNGIQISSTGRCSDQRNRNCTSLDGIPKSTIEDVINLKRGTGCSFHITGGTEDGHKTHGTGLPVVDLSEDECLSNYFQANKSSLGNYNIRKICADNNSQAAALNCGNFVEQKPHFHVQFDT